jgi:hypothetical protein
MTSTTTAGETAPTFQSSSPRAVLLRGLCLLALCTAILGGFLAQVWHAPQPDEDARAAAAAAVAQPKT